MQLSLKEVIAKGNITELSLPVMFQHNYNDNRHKRKKIKIRNITLN